MQNQSKSTRRGCFLDADSLGTSLNWQPLTDTLDHWQWHPATQPADVMANITGCEVVITNKVVLDADTLAATSSLKLVCISATGTNNVDLEAAKRLGIRVTHVAGYATDAVPQHVFALILGHATRWADYAQDVRAGRWSQSPFFCRLDYPINELAGATLGIIGFGTLGQKTAQLAEAFGMQVKVAERAGADSIRAGRHALEDVLREADYLSLHCPLTPDTEHLINHDTLALMKPNAYIINTARGQIIDDAALIAALKNGQIGGAALDVLSVEPPPADHPLLAADIPNLTITPHCAWGSQPARQRMLDTMATQIKQFYSGRLESFVV